MQKIDYIDAQYQLAKTMRQVCEKDTPVTINGAGKDQVVMMPLETFQKLNAKNQHKTQFMHEQSCLKPRKIG